MARHFSSATAEQVVAVVEAVVVRQGSADAVFVAEFADLTPLHADSALRLAADLGLLKEAGASYSPASPLCRFLITPNVAQRAAVIRVLLESYQPFLTFRDCLVATASASVAARQTKVALDLDAHRESVKDTLISLGTYSDALVTEGGGRFSPQPSTSDNQLEVMALAAGEFAAAEARVRVQLGPEACSLVDRDTVIVPLSNALLRACNTPSDPRGSVMDAGNAVESFLSGAGTRAGVDLVGATGINAKLQRFHDTGWLPKKLVFVGKSLGHVRNAADHGIDPDINAAWVIRNATGLEYVFLACSFIAAVTARELNRPAQI